MTNGFGATSLGPFVIRHSSLLNRLELPSGVIKAQSAVRKGYSTMRPLSVFTVGLLAFISGSVAGTELPNRAPQPPRPQAPGAELFAGTNVWPFTITIDSPNMQSLRRQPRAWAKGTVLLGKETYPDVGIHIKGSQGSLQAIDE